MFNVLIVEDQVQQRKKLVNILKKANYPINVLEAGTGKEAINILKNNTVHLFYLDINLPDMSGLKVAEHIRSIPEYEFSFIIMITTHVYYQLEAFKNLHCYDFIEKPYESDTVIKVTEKVLGGFKRLEQFLDSNNASVGFQLKHCLLKIDIDDILFIESHRRDCIVHTYNKVHSLPGYTMKKVLEIINKPYVMKTHKSYIINLKNIYEVEKIDRNSWIVYFEDYQEEALVSNTFKQEFSQKIAQEKRKEV